MATTGRYVYYGRKGIYYIQDGTSPADGVQLFTTNAQGLPILKLGTSSAPVIDTVAGNLANIYYTNSATSGDARAVYARLILSGATGTSGEAGRFYALASGAATALHGIHSTAQVSAGTGVSGQAAGVRATIATTTGLTLNAGTYAALRLDSSLASAPNATDLSWIYIADLDGTNKVTNFINFATVDTAAMYINAGTSSGSAGHADGGVAQKVMKCKVNGATVYIPVFTQNT